MFNEIIELSYAIAALMYLFFFLLLLTNRQHGGYQHLLLAVALAGFAWALHLWMASIYPSVILHDSFLFDGLRGWCWVLFFSAVVSGETRLFQALRATPVLLISGIILAVLLMIRTKNIEILILDNTQPILIFDLFISCLVLLFIERSYRLAEPETRVALRPLCITLGALYLLDLYMFSQSLLFGGVESSVWRLRGIGHLLSIPFFLLSTKQSESWSIRIFVSRAVIYNSSLLIFLGIYLLLMSLAGYYLKYIGGSWGNEMRLSFILLAMALLFVIFTSESIRRQAKVFITKHFFANKYEYGDEWLAVTQALSGFKDGSPYLQALQVIRDRLGTASAGLYRCREGSFELVSYLGEPVDIEAALERTSSFWSQQPWLLDLDEFRQYPNRYEGLVVDIELLTQNHYRIFMPLFHQQELFGVVGVGASRLNRLNFEDRDYLNTIASQLVNFLVLCEASRHLAEVKQFETFNQMSAFLVHDLKNTLAQLQMILVNAERHKRNPEFIDDSLDTLDNVVKRLQRTMEQLRRESRADSITKQCVQLSTVVNQVIRERSTEMPRPILGDILEKRIKVDASRFQSVLAHLIQNAQEATDDDGQVLLKVQEANDNLIITIADTGCGMDESFMRERLFRPFDTTKGNAGMGIGVYEARQFMEEFAGNLKVISELGRGTTFILTFPLPAIENSLE